MKIISWNVNGVRAAERKGFLKWLKEENPSIICLQETKAHEGQLSNNLRNPKGYHAYWNYPKRKGYSGVAIISKKKPIEIKTDFGKKSILSREGRMIETHFQDFILINIYFPNAKMGPERLDYKMKFYAAFLRYLNQLKKKGKKIIFCGDINTAHKEIDLFHPKPNSKNTGFLPQERAWIDKVIRDGYIDTLRVFNKKPHQYSWWDLRTRARDRNVGWRIDYFFISPNIKKNLKSAFILSEVMGSDHAPVGIEITF